MSVHSPHLRSLFLTGMALALLSAAGCQSMSLLSSFETDGASRSGESYLAEIRSSNGLSPLSPDGKLEKAARQQAGYMAGAGKMIHTTGWRKDFATRMNRNGIEGAAAENVAHGRMDLGKLFDMWMHSAGHRRNMLDPRFSKYGLASATASDGERYWALVLGR